MQDEHERWFSFSRKMSISGEKVARQTRAPWNRRDGSIPRGVGRIIGGMILMMKDARVMNMEELQ
ncbi:MAG: hypothetical protein U9Q23_01200, partial [Candidatus Bipolaricaulota bacterium]|nr:hypothetical protein [Candidatus Bipolaricaulota bacterium]